MLEPTIEQKLQNQHLNKKNTMKTNSNLKVINNYSLFFSKVNPGVT